MSISAPIFGETPSMAAAAFRGGLADVARLGSLLSAYRNEPPFNNRNNRLNDDVALGLQADGSAIKNIGCQSRWRPIVTL
ncbi:hypothetical protein MASR2M15_25340 [Anaerolineales bacterium]